MTALSSPARIRPCGKRHPATAILRIRAGGASLADQRADLERIARVLGVPAEPRGNGTTIAEMQFGVLRLEVLAAPAERTAR